MESRELTKAQLVELDAAWQKPINPDRTVTVQFNPETLKVAFQNQIVQPGEGSKKQGAGSTQFVGKGSTKLSLQLWFDVTAEQPGAANREIDVRELTKKVAYFITPREQDKNYIPPAVRFIWGSFKFDGIMESLEESLEFWSSEGVPLRASMSLTLSQQSIKAFEGRKGSAAGGQGESVGSQPLSEARSGDTLQGMAASSGKGGDWRGIAEANHIENPRLLPPGRLINLNPPAAPAPDVRFGVRR
jgi:hypothetical protein